MKTVSEYVSEKHGIDIRLYNPVEERNTSPGYTMKLDGTQFILLNSELSHQEQKTTFFHELGHCLMDYRENNAQSRREHEAVAEMTVSEFFAEMFAVVMNAIEINKEIIFNQEAERGAAVKKSIKIRLLEKDLTVPDLAAAIGKSTVYVSNALNFKTVLRADEAFKLGDMLGMTAEEVRAEFAETPYQPKEKHNVKAFKAEKS